MLGALMFLQVALLLRYNVFEELYTSLALKIFDDVEGKLSQRRASALPQQYLTDCEPNEIFAS